VHFSPPQVVGLYLALVVSMVVHEASHAFVAYLGGDRTAYEVGQVTLNPIPHMRREPFGMIVLPLISLFAMGLPFGFAHAPYNPYWAIAHPRRAAGMSAAGPAANLILFSLCFGVLYLGRQQGWFEIPYRGTPESSQWFLHALVGQGQATDGFYGALATGLSILMSLNLLLGLFNLLPIPPLDGAGVVEGLAPREVRNFLHDLRSNQSLQLVGLVLAIVVGWRLIGDWVFEPIYFLRAY